MTAWQYNLSDKSAVHWQTRNKEALDPYDNTKWRESIFRHTTKLYMTTRVMFRSDVRYRSTGLSYWERLKIKMRIADPGDCMMWQTIVTWIMSINMFKHNKRGWMLKSELEVVILNTEYKTAYDALYDELYRKLNALKEAHTHIIESNC